MKRSDEWRGIWSWVMSIRRDPERIRLCPCVDDFSGFDWLMILKDQPGLYTYCDWEKLDGSNTVVLLEHQSQFADKCDFDKLSDVNWRYLLRVKPQFRDKYEEYQFLGNLKI